MLKGQPARCAIARPLSGCTITAGVVVLINTYGPTLAEQTLLEVVVHRMRPQDFALPDSLGLQPGSITVTSEGLTIGFVPKGRPD